MAYSVRGRFTNQERYSNRRANQLLQLTKTKARDTQILEEALQKALDATEKAASRGEVFNLVTSVLGFAIPGPVDDMILKTINAAKQDSLRDDALKAGQIDMSEIDYLKKAAQNSQTQLEEAQLKMLEPMKFSTRFTQDVVPVALTTFEDIFKSGKINEKIFDDFIDDSVTRGIIDQSIAVNEIKRLAERGVKGLINIDDFMKNPTVKKFVDVYQGGDNVWKIYSDRFYQSALKQAFGDPKAVPEKVLAQVKDWYRTVAKEDFIEVSSITGAKKTADEALKEVSAYLVTNTIPTYSKVPKIIQSIRDLPLGNFIAFPAEILRTGSNLITLGARELTSVNPYIRQMGARRLIGASATFGGIGTVIGGTAQAITGVSDEMMQKARAFVPVYEQNATLIPVSSPDADGNFKYFNFSYSNPYDSLVRPLNAVVNAFGRGELNKDSEGAILFNSLIGTPDNPGALVEFFSPFISESIGVERITDVSLRGGRTGTGKMIYRETDPLGVKISRSLEHIIGGLNPGAFTSATKIWDGASGRFTDYGSERNLRDELVALMAGVRVQEVKPMQSMPFIITSFGRDKRNIGSKFASVAYSARSTPEQKINAYKVWVMDSFKSQKNLMNTVQAAEDLGVSRSDLRKVLNDRLKNKTEVQNLFSGKFKAPTPSDARVKSLLERLEDQNLEAALKFELGLDVAEEAWDDLRKDVRNYDLNDSLESFEAYIDAALTFGVKEARQLPPRGAKLAPINNVPAVLPVDQNKNLPVNMTSVNTTNLESRYNLLPTDQKFDKLFPFG